jgi:NAD(P)-dependent dehydrogenase (short-subunit alcohol dehydrogenase family)
LETPPETIEKTFAVNVNGPIYLTQSAIPHMSAGGRIINISSVASKLGMQYLPVYGASKAALDSLTFSWAKEVSSFPL